MDQSIQDILKTIDDSIAKFQDAIPAIQKVMYEELQPLVKQLEVSNGKLLNNVQNLKLLGSLKNTLEKVIINTDYKNSVSNFIDSFSDVSNLQTDYFKQFNQKFTPSKTLPIIKELAIEQTVNDLMGQGLMSNIIDPIKNIINQNITTGGNYAQFQEQLQNHILNNSTGDGALKRYTQQITTDAINQYNAQYAETIAQDLQFSWGRYVGSNIKTTREFCRCLTKKQWVHKSELPTIIEGDIDGHQCKLSKSTGLPIGMIPDTNASNFKIRRGGYNCGHQFFWVPDSAVPAAIKAALGNDTNPVKAAPVMPSMVDKNNIGKLDKVSLFKDAFKEFDSAVKLHKETGKTSFGTDLSGIEKYKLTEEEGKVIYTYTTNAHDEINSQLYSGNPSAPVKEFENLLNGILNKLPDYEGNVVRNYTPKNMTTEEQLKQYSQNIGGVIDFDGFLSTSKDPDFNWNLKIKYYIISKTGKLIENISAHSLEQEVLFKTKTKFIIINVEDNNVYLEEV